jgi:hypothetical protein
MRWESWQREQDGTGTREGRGGRRKSEREYSFEINPVNTRPSCRLVPVARIPRCWIAGAFCKKVEKTPEAAKVKRNNTEFRLYSSLLLMPSSSLVNIQ